MEAKSVLKRELEDLLHRDGEQSAEALRGQLQARANHDDLHALVDVAGDVLVVSVIVKRGGETAIERFELDPRSPRPPGARPNATGSVAARERSARKEAEDGLVGGIVDALELQYKANGYREQVKAESGLLYDLVNLGAQTFRELLQLNARANRRLLTAMRTVTASGSSGQGVHVTASGKGTALIQLDPGGGTEVALVLENHRKGELAVTLPCEVSLGLPDGTGARTLELKCRPDRVVLARGERREVQVSLASAPPAEMRGRTYLGELMLTIDDGGLARVPAALTVAPEAKT